MIGMSDTAVCSQRLSVAASSRLTNATYAHVAYGFEAFHSWLHGCAAPPVLLVLQISLLRL